MKKTKGYITVMAEYPNLTYHLVNGYEVNLPGVSAFLHKDHCAGKGFVQRPDRNAKWVITERTSGLLICKGVTQDIAIQNAQTALFNHGGDKVADLITSQVARFKIAIPV